MFVNVGNILRSAEKLNGQINHLTFQSQIQKTYAPDSHHLLAANVVASKWQEDNLLEHAMSEQIRQWLEIPGQDLTHLHTYTISHALPNQSPKSLASRGKIKQGNKLYLAGEASGNASINGALASGKKVAKAVLSDF